MFDTIKSKAKKAVKYISDNKEEIALNAVMAAYGIVITCTAALAVKATYDAFKQPKQDESDLYLVSWKNDDGSIGTTIVQGSDLSVK